MLTCGVELSPYSCRRFYPSSGTWGALRPNFRTGRGLGSAASSHPSRGIIVSGGDTYFKAREEGHVISSLAGMLSLGAFVPKESNSAANS